MYLHLRSSTGHGVQSLPEVAEKGVSGGREAEDGD